MKPTYEPKKQMGDFDDQPTLSKDQQADKPDTVLDGFEAGQAELWFRRIAELTVIAQKAMPDASPDIIQKHVSTYQIECSRRPVSRDAPPRALGAAPAAQAPQARLTPQMAKTRVYDALRNRTMPPHIYKDFKDREARLGKFSAWKDDDVVTFVASWNDRGGVHPSD